MKGTFDPKKGPVPVNCFLVGPSGMGWIRLIVDTATTITTLASSILPIFGYRLDDDAPTIEVGTVTGSTKLSRLIVSHLAIGEFSATRFPVLVADLPVDAEFDGLLGLDFFRDKLLSIDFGRGRFSIQ